MMIVRLFLLDKKVIIILGQKILYVPTCVGLLSSSTCLSCIYCMIYLSREHCSSVCPLVDWFGIVSEQQNAAGSRDKYSPDVFLFFVFGHCWLNQHISPPSPTRGRTRVDGRNFTFFFFVVGDACKEKNSFPNDFFFPRGAK